MSSPIKIDSDEEKEEEMQQLPAAVGLTHDLHHRVGYYSFAVTLTAPDQDGFSKDQEKMIKEWHKHNSDQCVLSRESHASGLPHYHSYLTCKNKQPAGLTRKLKTLYKTMDMPWSHNAVKVKTCTHPGGWYHYILKDLSADQNPLLTKGFKLSFIRDEALKSLKQREHKRKGRSEDDPFLLGSKNSVRIMLEFAKRKAMPINCKHTFALVCHAMAQDNYSFDRIRLKNLYCQLRSRQGDSHAMVSWVLGGLNFLDD